MKQVLRQPLCLRLTTFVFLALLTVSFHTSAFAQTVGTSPSAINFGSVATSSSSTRAEIIRNSGSAALTLTRVSARGRAFDVSGPDLPLSLDPGASATFSVRFSPTSAGNFSNSLVIGFVSGKRGRRRNFDSTAVALVGTGATSTPTCSLPQKLINGTCQTPPVTTPPPVITPPPPPVVVTCTPPQVNVNDTCVDPSEGKMWVPPVNTTWTWWLSKVPSASNLPAQNVIDSDGVDTPASTVAAIRAAGKHWVCYVDVGTWEPGRPDAGQFPDSVKGSSVDGFASEKWLDIRQTDILLPIMSQRIKNCADKGAQAVEPDDIDGYTNGPGFSFTRADQVAYNKAIALIVHNFGMSVALKNDGDDVGTLLPSFDFAIVEQCIQYKECSTYSPFVAAGKSVLVAEYQGNFTDICGQLAPLKMNGILTNINLTGTIQSCH